MQTHFIHTIDALHAYAQSVVERLIPQESTATILALSGDLGAGKTAFTKAVGQVLGVQEIITSPTFIIQKVYPTQHPLFSKLVHIDAYRLEGEHELTPLGWDEILADPRILVCIEWPERVEGVLPPETQRIFFETVDENTRRITKLD